MGETTVLWILAINLLPFPAKTDTSFLIAATLPLPDLIENIAPRKSAVNALGNSVRKL